MKKYFNPVFFGAFIIGSLIFGILYYKLIFNKLTLSNKLIFSESNNYFIDGNKKITSGLFIDAKGETAMFIGKIGEIKTIDNKIIISASYFDKSGKINTQDFEVGNKNISPFVIVELQKNHNLFPVATDFLTKNIPFNEAQNFFSSYKEKLVIFNLVMKSKKLQKNMNATYKPIAQFANVNTICINQFINNKYKNIDVEITCIPFSYLIRLINP